MFDSHCHLDFPEFAADRSQLLATCQQQGIDRLLIPATEVAGFSQIAALCQAHPEQLCFALGLHPWFLRESAAELQQLRAWLSQRPPGLVAVGECGLDFALQQFDREQQLTTLRGQLALAVEFNLPVILHVRKAHNELLTLLKSFPELRGVVHAFTGSLQLAEQYIERNLLLGVGGAISYPRAAKTRACIAQLPLRTLLLETDAPNMPLHGFQGQRNSPLQLTAVAGILAELTALPLQTVITQTDRNAQQLFGVPCNYR